MKNNEKQIHNNAALSLEKSDMAGIVGRMETTTELRSRSRDGK